ncbi:DNA helicase [Tanacetum coccineum]
MSFTEGPRYMYAHYLDALAICRKLGNPQFFITFTCNVNWPEIKRYMADYPYLTPSDRADVVCRVFEQKIQALLAFLKTEKTFGDVTGVLYTVEFQKRGLPHCHTLLWVNSESKIKEAQDVDRFVSAELPDPEVDPEGYRVVSEMMMHGPCGAAKMSAPCMKGDKCSKNFPKKYTSHTFFDDKGHVHYKRRDTSISTTKHQFGLDNSYVVPYNRDLLLAFEAHINVEYCGWSMLIKYLFKYISKGTDRIFARVSKPLGESSNVAGPSCSPVDEIQNYLEGRFICAHEAYWRILKFDIHRREPAVQILSVHLQDMQRVTFRDRDKLESVVNLPGRKSTTLTEWFAYNEANEDGRHLTYQDFPSEFVWYDDRKCWSRRRNSKSSIGRLAYVHPTSGELFYFRMLLCHRKGCTEFIDVQTINDVFYPTCRAACEALGLLGDDKEWDIAMQEASVSATSSELRFVVTTFGLPLPPQDQIDMLDNRLFMEKRIYNQQELMQERDESVPKLNTEQRKIYDLIIDVNLKKQQELIFVYGHGGTVKPQFLYVTAHMELSTIAQLNIRSAYRISNFICEPTSSYQQTLENKTSLRFGKFTKFDNIPATTFPHHYFEFTSYNRLESKIPKPDNNNKMQYPILTDYMGCIRSISGVSHFRDPNRSEKTLRKIEIENLNGNIIELTLWDEMAEHFGQADLEKMEQPVIIAVSSCRVSKYRDYQLAATPATYYYLNPNIPEAETSRALYKAKYQETPPLIVCKFPHEDIDQEKQRNRFPLKTLLEQNPQSYKAIRFTAEATIKSINTKREWFYESCHQCSRTAVKRGDNYTCLDHGPQLGPFFRYKFKAYITDASGTTSLTFFTPAADKITGHSCKELVKKYKACRPKKDTTRSLGNIGKNQYLSVPLQHFCTRHRIHSRRCFQHQHIRIQTSFVLKTEPSVRTLPGTTHLTTDKEYSEEEEETSTPKEVNKGTPILSPAITTKTGKSQEEDDRAYEKSAKRRLILEPSAETKKPKGD